MSTLAQQITQLFNKTDKPFLTMSYIKQELGIDFSHRQALAADAKWCTLIIHEKGFLKPHQSTYARAAERNIPHIQFADNEFETRFERGGCCYVIYRDEAAYDDLIGSIA